MNTLIPSSLDTPQNVGLLLSFLIAILGILSRSNTFMELLEGGLKKIMCIPKMFEIAHIKMRQPIDVVKEIDRQDTNIVRSKLGLPDGVAMGLYEIAPGKDGTINTKVALAWIEVINMAIENKNEQLKPLEMKK